MTREQLATGLRPTRRLNAREARWVAELDNTPYTVVLGGKYETRIQVTGYTSARVVAKSATRAVILTATEASRLSRAPYFN